MKWDIEHYVNGGESEFPLTGLANVVSHIGPVKIRKPITDVMMRVDMEEPFEMVSVVPYSVQSETENTVRTHLVYGSNGISKEQIFVQLSNADEPMISKKSGILTFLMSQQAKTRNIKILFFRRRLPYD